VIGGWLVFEVAGSVAIRRSGRVQTSVVINEWPSVDGFHTFSLTGKEIPGVVRDAVCR
jgi:hypothetical protein